MSNTKNFETIQTRLDNIEIKRDQKAEKADIGRLDKKIDRDQNELKSDIVDLESRLGERFEVLLQGMDRIIKELETLRTEQKVVNAALNFHERRIGDLEQSFFW